MTDVIKEKCRICHKPWVPYAMGEKNGYLLFACQACGSVMTDPVVTPEMRDAFFGEIQPQITHIPNPTAEIEKVKKIIKSIYPEPAGKTFLDVYCRNGYAVVAAKLLGMTAIGIDPHEFYVDFAQKKYDETLFVHETIEDRAARGEEYDLVFAREIFCEVADVDSVAASLAKLVSPKGVVYLQEPDGNSFNVPRHFNMWPIVYPPLNCNYPSKRGLREILTRNGLRVRKTYWNWRPIMRMLASGK